MRAVERVLISKQGKGGKGVGQTYTYNDDDCDDNDFNEEDA
jgi:hypothetical protein